MGRRNTALNRRVAASSDRCTWCGREISTLLPRGHPAKSTADHVIALAAGGADVEENLVPACARCNRRKWNRPAGTLRTTVLTEW